LTKNALEYSNSVCRPKIMYVTVNKKLKTFAAKPTSKITLEFNVKKANTAVHKSIDDAINNPKKPFTWTATFPGAKDVDAFGIFYKAEGAQSLLASMSAAGAALVAISLF